MTIVLTVMAILISMAMPRFSRSLESAKADVAGANLRAIWAAERLYWLDHRNYTSSLDTLVSQNLLDPSITANTSYSYLVTTADSTTFSATAQRLNGSWSGSFTIDQTGAISGNLTCPGQDSIVVGFQ